VIWKARATPLMPQAFAAINSDERETGEDIEREVLGLPSDFSSEERARLDLQKLSIRELFLRQKEAFQALDEVRLRVKTLGALARSKRVHDRGRAQNTRSSSVIRQQEVERDYWMRVYNSTRTVMLTLVPSQSKPGLAASFRNRFPPLEIKDTVRKAPELRRSVGSSRITDGALWAVNPRRNQDLGRADPTILTDRPIEDRHSPKPCSDASGSLTEGSSKQKDRIVTCAVSNANEDGALEKNLKTASPDCGWLWTDREQVGMSQLDREGWEEEGDRVHWFRSEAEVYRWLEQVELKHCEFERTIKSLDFTAQTWRHAIDRAVTLPSHFVAYAQRQFAIHKDLVKETQDTYDCCRRPEFTSGEGKSSFVDRVLAFRSKVLSELLQEGLAIR